MQREAAISMQYSCMHRSTQRSDAPNSSTQPFKSGNLDARRGKSAALYSCMREHFDEVLRQIHLLNQFAVVNYTLSLALASSNGLRTDKGNLGGETENILETRMNVFFNALDGFNIIGEHVFGHFNANF